MSENGGGKGGCFRLLETEHGGPWKGVRESRSGSMGLCPHAGALSITSVCTSCGALLEGARTWPRACTEDTDASLSPTACLWLIDGQR